MKRLISLLALSIPCAVASPAPAMEVSQAPASGAIEELIQAHQLRPGQSDEQGLASLAKIFAPDVRMFIPPVPGFAIGRAEALAHLQQAFGAADAKLSWAPVRYGISADGKQGFSFGYTEAETAAGNTPGKYLAYWVRGADGWQIALFKIVPRAPGEITRKSMDPAVPSAAAWRSMAAASKEQFRASLIAREKAFSDEAQRIGLGPAFAAFGSTDAVNAGGEVEFVVGNAAIGDLHGTGPSPFWWAADDVIVSDAGDLGVTWGILHRTGPTPPGRSATIPFFTVWRRSSPDAPWLYVAE